MTWENTQKYSNVGINTCCMHLNSCECEMQMNMLKIQLLRYVCVCVSRCTYYILFIFTFIVPYTSVPPSSKPMVEAETEKASSMQRSKDPRNPNLCHLLMSEGHPLQGEKIDRFFDDICFGENGSLEFYIFDFWACLNR